jgi:ATP-dependent Clp protease ATP-binding subunit ClpA
MPVFSIATVLLVPRYLPDKALDLVDEACARVRVEISLKPEVREAEICRSQLTASLLVQDCSAQTHMCWHSIITGAKQLIISMQIIP